jgi:hypothetical protein
MSWAAGSAPSGAHSLVAPAPALSTTNNAIAMMASGTPPAASCDLPLFAPFNEEESDGEFSSNGGKT